MDFFRQNVLRRAGPVGERAQDVEQQRSQEPSPSEMAERREPQARRFPLSRPTLPSLFTTRSRQAPQDRNDQGREEDESESPKTPRFNVALGTLPSTRLHLPHLTRTWTRGSAGPPSPTNPTPTTNSHAHASASNPQPPTIVVEPPAVHAARDMLHPSRTRTRYEGPDPAESQLASMANDGRDRSRRRRQRRNSDEESGRSSRDSSRDSGAHPKRFMYCFPWVKSRRVRVQILRCFVSGMFLLLLLTIYLALSVTKNINTSEFTVLLILIILFTTIFFCHGLIRLCMLVMKPPNEEAEAAARAAAAMPEMFGPGGYAVPRRPIRVVLARDEEAAGLESETTKLQPPAYGLWRESVRVDPNRIYWQRNEDASPSNSSGSTSRRSRSRSASSSSSEEEEDQERPGTARPPSYASEDGVSYVVEARPRSVAPLTDVPLPPHPSERPLGRPAIY